MNTGCCSRTDHRWSFRPVVMLTPCWSFYLSIHSLPEVTLKQVTPYRWELISPTGVIMVDTLLFASPWHAEDWLQKYLTTWPTWSYKIKLLERQLKRHTKIRKFNSNGAVLMAN